MLVFYLIRNMQNMAKHKLNNILKLIYTTFLNEILLIQSGKNAIYYIIIVNLELK